MGAFNTGFDTGNLHRHTVHPTDSVPNTMANFSGTTVFPASAAAEAAEAPARWVSWSAADAGRWPCREAAYSQAALAAAA